MLCLLLMLRSFWVICHDAGSWYLVGSLLIFICVEESRGSFATVLEADI